MVVIKINITDKKATTLTGKNINSISVAGLSLSSLRISSLKTHHRCNHHSRAKIGPPAMSTQINPTLTTLTTAKTMSATEYINITEKLINIVNKRPLPVVEAAGSRIVL